jgi:DNA-binding MarR family transcriptional regulator
MLWRKTNLAGELPPEDADDTEFRSFWDKVILPALQTDYPELLRVSEDDPLGAVRQRIAAIELLARLLESGSSPAAKENDGGNAKPDADDVLDKIDMAILTALSKSKSSLLLEELAENAGYQRKTCGKHVERLLNAGLLTRKSKRSGVAITAAGRARIAPTKLP